MLLVVDSGSTRIHIGWWDHGRVVQVEEYTYPVSARELEELLTGCCRKQSVDGTAACSVSPVWRDTVFSVLQKVFPWELRVARTADDAGVRVSYEKPDTYGIDRALAVTAAYRRFRNSCVVVDAGTAVTVDAVRPDGSVAGGFIMPGGALQAAALASGTGLPLVSMNASTAPLGTSTEQGIRLGIRYGIGAAAQELIQHAAAEVDAADRVILTGGCVPVLSPILPGSYEVAPNLVLEGLGYAYHTLPPFA